MTSLPCENATQLFVEDSQFAREAYLRDRNGNAEMARRYMEEGKLWRRKVRPDLIKISEVARVIERYGIFRRGFARNGNAIVWIDAFSSAHRQLVSCSFTEVRDIFRAFVYAAENSVTPQTPHVDFVVNCAGLSRAQLDELFLRMATHISELAFPDAFCGYHFHNFPTLYGILWKVLAPFLPLYWRQRIHIYHGRAGHGLLEVADASQLPARYGGACADSDFSAATYVSERKCIEAARQSQLPDENATEMQTDGGIPPFTLLLTPLSCDPQSVPDLIFFGKLKKQGGVAKMWKSVYLLLRPACMLYFKKEHDTLPTGAIDMNAVERVRIPLQEDVEECRHLAGRGRRACGFVIVARLRKFFFISDSSSQRDLWITHISSAVVNKRRT